MTCSNRFILFLLAIRVPPRKPATKKLVEEKTESGCKPIKLHIYSAHYFLLFIMIILTLRFFIQGARKTPPTPQKIKTKAVVDPIVIESDEKDLSPVLDLTLRKRKKQPKVVEASSQPHAKISRVIKRHVALSILEPTPIELSKIAAAQVESDNSSPRVEGNKVKIIHYFIVIFYYFD